ncbi:MULTISPECIES: BON domain-containing protein [Catenuloplanes]|uniref:Osmotically-inducible protein OsmY n=1 Tax=Catenuloplanes niger TaxID=587534 RepID=A0AAE4CXJ0_9ACTN|nr:BON domain-containing protein [Catenuloplanes niger]MDR7327537.1 osmotically-inducible protein OsmY [Catenuloplanes niger]
MGIPYPDDDDHDDDYHPGPHADGTGEPADERIRRMVVHRLMRVAHLRAQLARVSVQNRVVILEGDVDTAELAVRIGEEVWQTPGVIDVCNALAIPGGWDDALP